MLRVKEVAARLAISTSKVYVLIGTGALPHHRIDGAIRVSEEQIAAFLDATKRETHSPLTTKAPTRRMRLRSMRI